MCCYKTPKWTNLNENLSIYLWYQQKMFSYPINREIKSFKFRKKSPKITRRVILKYFSAADPPIAIYVLGKSISNGEQPLSIILSLICLHYLHLLFWFLPCITQFKKKKIEMFCLFCLNLIIFWWRASRLRQKIIEQITKSHRMISDSS